MRWPGAGQYAARVRRRFVFVYNADGGLWNLLADAAHKVLSPATYPCSLCALTYGPLGMKRTWARFVRTLPGEVVFLHKDELARERGAAPIPALPALLEGHAPAYQVLLAPDRIDRCRDLDALIAEVRGVI